MRRALQQKNPGASFLLVAACLVIVVSGLRAAESILVPMMVAVFLAILSSPLLAWLVARRVPSALAVVLTMLTNVAMVAALAFLVGGSVNNFVAKLPEYQEAFENRVSSLAEWLGDRGIRADLPWLLPEDQDSTGNGTADRGDVDRGSRPSFDQTAEAETSLVPGFSADGGNGAAADSQGLPLMQILDIGAVTDLIARTLRSVASLLSNTLLVLLMLAFILMETASLPKKLELAFGWESDHLSRLSKARREVQHYLVIKTLISACTGALIGLWVAILQVDFPLLWALLAFVLNYIPNLGSILAAIPPCFLALVADGFGHALLVGMGYLVVNLVVGNFVDPYLMGRRLGLSTLVVFLSLLFWGWVWGPVGMLLSVPLTMILKIVLENTRDFRWLAHLLGSNPRPQTSLPTT